MPLIRPYPAPVAAGDELHPAALCTPTTLRTSVRTIVNLELGQPYIVHDPRTAQSAKPKECGAAAPLTLDEIAGAMRRQAGDLIEQGLAKDEGSVEAYAGLIEALHHEPSRRDLAWQLGLDQQVADPALRQAELRNFIEHLVLPVRRSRGRASPARRPTTSRDSASETASSHAASGNMAGSGGGDPISSRHGQP